MKRKIIAILVTPALFWLYIISKLEDDSSTFKEFIEVIKDIWKGDR